MKYRKKPVVIEATRMPVEPGWAALETYEAVLDDE